MFTVIQFKFIFPYRRIPIAHPLYFTFFSDLVISTNIFPKQNVLVCRQNYCFSAKHPRAHLLTFLCGRTVFRYFRFYVLLIYIITRVSFNTFKPSINILFFDLNRKLVFFSMDLFFALKYYELEKKKKKPPKVYGRRTIMWSAFYRGGSSTVACPGATRQPRTHSNTKRYHSANVSRVSTATNAPEPPLSAIRGHASDSSRTTESTEHSNRMFGSGPRTPPPAAEHCSSLRPSTASSTAGRALSRVGPPPLSFGPNSRIRRRAVGSDSSAAAVIVRYTSYILVTVLRLFIHVPSPPPVVAVETIADVIITVYARSYCKETQIN